MIIVRIHGGLGNQMFQYALGRNLSQRLGVEFKLDVSWFNPARGFSYGLDVFDVQQAFASDDEVERLKRPRPSRYECIRNCIRGWGPDLPLSFIRELQFPFDPKVLSLPDNVYLDGYWQSESYFAEISDQIRRELTVRAPQTGRNLALAEAIADSDSVSLHVRRGDYVSNPRTNAFHGVCSLDYYRRCIEALTERVPSPHFFLFSDDPEWVRDNLELQHPTTLVDNNGPDIGHEDIRLMSQCRHHILANSSFSWWGAWLTPNPDKLVYAPRLWFIDADLDTSTLLPDSWQRY